MTYEKKSVIELREIAKERKIKGLPHYYDKPEQ